jgi:hypothetical protein
VIFNYETGNATMTLSLGVSVGALGGGAASAQAGFIFGAGDAAARYASGGNTTVNVGATVAASVATSGGMSTTSPITAQSPFSPESSLAIGAGLGISLTAAYASLTSDNTMVSWDLGNFMSGPASLLATGLDKALTGVREMCK